MIGKKFEALEPSSLMKIKGGKWKDTSVSECATDKIKVKKNKTKIKYFSTC